MRYIEIVRPSADTFNRRRRNRSCSGRTARWRDMDTAGANDLSLVSNSVNQINRPSRRPHLSPQRSQ